MDGNNEYFASINEVSKRLSLPAHTLRYWEKQFPTAIRPTTGAGGRRYYRAETVERLMVIKDLLYNRGMTIAGVKKMMRDGAMPSPDDVTPASGAASVDATVAPAINMAAIDDAISLLTQARALLN